MCVMLRRLYDPVCVMVRRFPSEVLMFGEAPLSSSVLLKHQRDITAQRSHLLLYRFYSTTKNTALSTQIKCVLKELERHL